MEDKKDLIVYKETIFSKIKRLFTNIFHKNTETIELIQPQTTSDLNNIPNSKQKFNEYISFKENKEELNLIDSIRNNTDILEKMSYEELNKVEKAILNRINYVDKRIAKLKTDLKIKRNEI